MRTLRFFALIVIAATAGLFGWQDSHRPRLQQDSRGGRPAQQAVDVQGTFLGDPISGISATEFELFRLGLEDFTEVESAGEGLGPVFNGRSCAECHSIPRIGGSGTVMEPRAGILHDDGTFEELEGGSLFQMFSIPLHSVQASIPPEANVVAFRKSLPLFGNGLVEAVPDATLRALADPDDLDGDGVSGRAAEVFDRASAEVRVGRFGWKAQQASLFVFGAEAYRDEMGITSDLFPFEACPNGVNCDLLEFIDPVSDPEDAPEPLTGLRGIDNFDNFMKFLGPPPRGEMTSEVLQGEELFERIGCQACHVAVLETGQATSPALSFKTFAPYGDFLVHDIGTGDGIAQAGAAPNEVRTAPLWGLRFRGPFLHDGRASDLRRAIDLHRGEADSSRSRYKGLSEEERRLLIAFLRSL